MPVRQKSTGLGGAISAATCSETSSRPLETSFGPVPVGPSQHCTYIFVNSTETGTPLFGLTWAQESCSSAGSFPVGVALRRSAGILDPSTVNQKPITFAGTIHGLF